MKLKNRRKYKYINGSKGVISIFLCIIMIPIWSIASALIEYSRYQSAIETFQEVVDCSSLSTLANYDSYLEERFGLFAVSQDCDIQNTYADSMASNTAILGNSMTLGNNLTAKGVLALSEPRVLKQQVLDFSESTVLSEILLSDLNIQDLIDKLNSLESLTTLASVAEDLANLTTAIEELVKKGEALVNTLNSAKEQINTISTKGNELITLITEFHTKLSEEGFTTDTEDDSYLKTLVENYGEDIENIYLKFNELMSSIENLEGTLNEIPTKLEEFETAFNNAKELLLTTEENTSEANEQTSSSSKDSTLAESTDEATNLFKSIVTELEKALEDAKNTLKEDTINNFKSLAAEFKEDLNQELGILDAKRQEFTEYFKLPLSEKAKENLKTLISEYQKTSASDYLTLLKEKYYPTDLVNQIFNNLSNRLNTYIQNAKTNFENRAEESISEILTTLVTAINGLFNLDVFYDGSLNAYLSDECMETLLSDPDGNNPYITLLNAISSLLSAVDNFIKHIGGWNFFGILAGAKDLFTALKDVLTSIVQVTENTINKIEEVVGYATSGDWNAFYELLLYSGYVTHNLPNRTMVDGEKTTLDDGVITYKKILNGESLTGYKYANIAVPSTEGVGGIGDGITGLVKFLGETQSGGSDEMFKGAEAEYVLAGTQSEIMNQTVTFMDLYILRMLLDTISIFTDEGVATMAASATIASWAVYLLVLVAEPLCDTVLLVNGAESYLYKTSCYLTPAGIPYLIDDLKDVAIKNENISASVDKLANDITGKIDTKGTTFSEGGVMKMDYSTHLLLLLMFSVTENNMLTRLANIIQLESAYYYKQSGEDFTFDIKESYTAIEATADVEFNSFISVFQFNDSSVMNKTFKDVRGY